MLNPIISVFLHFPLKFCFTVLVMIDISAFTYITIRRMSNRELITRKKGILSWVLINYLLVLFFLTIFGRRSWDYYRYNFDIEYSYLYVLTTSDYNMAIQIIVNIGAFAPIGMMAYYLCNKCAFKKSVCFGMVVSLLIELLQLLLKRGFFEFDDLMSNIIGTIVGSLLIVIYRFIRIKKVRS